MLRLCVFFCLLNVENYWIYGGRFRRVGGCSEGSGGYYGRLSNDGCYGVRLIFV